MPSLRTWLLALFGCFAQLGLPTGAAATALGRSQASNNPENILTEGVSDGAFTLAGVEVGEALCNTCKKVVRIVDQVLRLNSTKQEVFQSATARLCTYLPEAEQTACNVLTRRTHNSIYQCVLHSISVSTICSDQRVSLCPVSGGAEGSIGGSPCTEAGLQQDKLLCAGCEFSIGALQLYMNHSSSQLVRAFQRDICATHFDAGAEEAVCLEMLSLFGSLLVRTSIARINAAGICCSVGVC
jgi:hypothetical protein